MGASIVKVTPISARDAAAVVIEHHYLHRRPPISHAFGLFDETRLAGVVTYGVPASRHLQISACPTAPNLVLELNRLWVEDAQPRNTESWFVGKTLRALPARVIVSYADPLHGHLGIIYRAMSWNYAGWTDMDRKTPRYDYIPADPATHTRDAFRNGYVERRRRIAKVKYWTTSGPPLARRFIAKLCPWPALDWTVTPPPVPDSIYPATPSP